MLNWFECLWTTKDKEKIFWNWFSKNQDKYFHLEDNDQEALLLELKKELSKIDQYLTFQISRVKSDGKRELVISADGNKGSFPQVTKIVEKAPSLEHWTVVAFRQPDLSSGQLQIEDTKVKFSDVYFSYVIEGRKIGVELQARGFYESSEWKILSFLLIDHSIGEYETEMSIGSINIKELSEEKIPDLFPLHQLPKVLESFKASLHNEFT